MNINEQKDKSYKQRLFLSIICLIFSIASWFLIGLAGMFGLVNIFALSKNLNLVVNVFFILALALSLLAVFIDIVILLKCKKLMKESSYSKIKSCIIGSLVFSSYVILVCVIMFIGIIETNKKFK